MENNDLISTTSNIINVDEQTFMSEVVEVSKTKPVIGDFGLHGVSLVKLLHRY